MRLADQSATIILMICRPIFWILLMIFAGILLLPFAGQAQPPVKPGQGPGQGSPGQPPPSPQQPPGQPPTERRPPAPEYALAILATILVLVIVCMPSRKRLN
jgi:hypothetical protein